MLGINGWELLVLAILALLVLGPDKLPRYAAEAGRMLRQVRRMAEDARAEVARELGPEFRDISLDDLNPRTFVRRQLLDDDLDLDLDFDEERTDDRGGARDDGQQAAAQPAPRAAETPRTPRSWPGYGEGARRAEPPVGPDGEATGESAAGPTAAPSAGPAPPPYDPDAT